MKSCEELMKAYEKLKKVKQTLEQEQDDVLMLLAEEDHRIKKFKTLLQENKIEFLESESEEESDDMKCIVCLYEVFMLKCEIIAYEMLTYKCMV